MEFKFFENESVTAARHDMVDAGYIELSTPDEVDTAFAKEGTTFVLVNSVCGCAGSIARPAATSAIHYDMRPDHLVTVFAGQDKDATIQARKYFGGNPPSSPSMALLKDGEIVAMLHREDIEGFMAINVIMKIQRLYDQFCEEL